MTRPLILALDIGTSSVRAALYDHSANVLPETMVKHERFLESTDEGGAELDAKLAFQQVVDAIDDLLDRSAEIEGEITHVACSAFWHSLLGVDASGKPTTKVLGWADTRSRKQIGILRSKLNEKTVHSRTGARFHSSYWPAKLLWLRKDLPEQFKATSLWLSLCDYVFGRLTGEFWSSVSMCSGTGLFDQRSCEWDTDLVKFLNLRPSNLPQVAGDQETARLKRQLAKRWPRLAEAEIFPAIGDGAANNLGSGCTTSDSASLMIGTSGAMRVVVKGGPPKEIPSGLWCYRVDRQNSIIGGALSDGGGLYQWLRDNLNIQIPDDDLEDAIAAREPDGHGLIFLPFLAGERSTGYHENAAGAVIGLHTSTDQVDIVQAALEAVAYRFADIFDQLKKIVRIKRIVASGGALRESPVWTQIIADVLQKDLELPDVREASSRGVVIFALQRICGRKSESMEDTKMGRLFRYNPQLREAYGKGRLRHSELYGHLYPQ